MATERHQPLVSVIIPMYNAEDTIERAIRSCLDQTMPDLELVVIDDASSDGSCAVVRALVDNRVRLHSLPTNGGPADARNRGIELSAGDWLTFLDADDWYHPTRLEKLLAVARCEPPRTVVMDVMDGDKTSLSHKTGVYTVETLPKFGLSPFVSRQHISDAGALFPPGVRYGEDTAFLFLLMSAPDSRLVRIPDRLYHYSRTDDSLTSQVTRFEELARAYDFLLESGKLPPGVRQRIVDSRAPLEVEHAYETAQLAFYQHRHRDFVKLVASTPVIIPLALGRMLKSIALRFRAETVRRHRRRQGPRCSHEASDCGCGTGPTRNA